MNRGQNKKNKISFFELYGKISAAFAVGFFMSMSVSVVESHAEMNKNIILAAVDTKSMYSKPTSPSKYPLLFGKSETKYNDISAFTKWSDMFKRFQDQISQHEGHDEMVEWENMLKDQQSKSLIQKIQNVNDYVNRIEFVPDAKNYHKADYWATPLQFFERGGDCEDYAITKYVSLRALGVPGDQMRIAIVRDKILRVPHAVLVVYVGNDALVLDNQQKDIYKSNFVNRYEPIYSISQVAWWRH